MFITRSYLHATLLVDIVSCIGGETVCSCCAVVLANRPDHPPPAPVASHHPLHLAVEEAVGEADYKTLQMIMMMIIIIIMIMMIIMIMIIMIIMIMIMIIMIIIIIMMIIMILPEKSLSNLRIF